MLASILIISGIVLLLQDDILSDYHKVEVAWIKKAAGSVRYILSMPKIELTAFARQSDSRPNSAGYQNR